MGNQERISPVRLTGSLPAGTNTIGKTFVTGAGGDATITVGGDTSSNSSLGLLVLNRNQIYNENTWERQRGNTTGTLLASAARTAVATSPNQTNYNARGVLLVLSVTAASGTGGLVVRLGSLDPVSSSVFAIMTPSSAITAIGVYSFLVYPGVAAGIATGVTNAVVPRTWYGQVGHNDASSYTYSLGYSLIL